jgi:hypothetical protein
MIGAVAIGWVVLALVFLDEVAAMVGLGVYGWSAPARWLLVWLLPVAGCAVWATFASPRARLGSGVRRPLAKVVVFGAASLGLWAAGHPAWAVALVAFSVVVNAVAQLPSIRTLGAPAAR